MAQLERVRSYEPDQLSGNEHTILALGEECERLAHALGIKVGGRTP